MPQVHVIGACQIYEHSGNMTFLNLSYAFYKELFWDGIGGMVWGYGYDSVLCLNKMAAALGHHNDTAYASFRWRAPPACPSSGTPFYMNDTNGGDALLCIKHASLYLRGPCTVWRSRPKRVAAQRRGGGAGTGTQVLAWTA